jgi:hypothetical protein
MMLVVKAEIMHMMERLLKVTVAAFSILAVVSLLLETGVSNICFGTAQKRTRAVFIKATGC